KTETEQLGQSLRGRIAIGETTSRIARTLAKIQPELETELSALVARDATALDRFRAIIKASTDSQHPFRLEPQQILAGIKAAREEIDAANAQLQAAQVGPRPARVGPLEQAGPRTPQAL